MSRGFVMLLIHFWGQNSSVAPPKTDKTVHTSAVRHLLQTEKAQCLIISLILFDTLIYVKTI